MQNAVTTRAWRGVLAAVTTLFAMPVLASPPEEGDDFYSLYVVLHDDWIQGGLGVALGLLAFLVGIGFAVGKNNPMMAVSGLVIAAMIAFLPPVIVSMIAGGAVIV